MDAAENRLTSELPPEILLNILKFTTLPSIAALYRVSRGVKSFLDHHEKAVLSQLLNYDASQIKSFARYYDGADGPKELLKRQTILSRNWESPQPLTKQTVVNSRNSTWRFRPDFKRRLIISTSEPGGVKVICMDTGRRLWGHKEVRSFAHLEYDEVDGHGMAVWDRMGNSLEVWRTTEERGKFEQLTILHHDCETRGFQLSYDTLCVVSTEGQAFVYDMKARPKPKLVTHLDNIQDDAVGHLDQDKDHVMFSLGRNGYHIHEKSTGRFVGAIEPWRCVPERFFRLEYPKDYREVARGGYRIPDQNPPDKERFFPAEINRIVPPEHPNSRETYPADSNMEYHNREIPYVELSDDDWGAGMLSGNVMVGVSGNGRVIVVPNWRDCLSQIVSSDQGNSAGTTSEHSSGPDTNHDDNSEMGSSFERNAYLIHHVRNMTPQQFEMGGWLSIRNNRILFEVRDLIYVVALDDDGNLSQQGSGTKCGSRPSYACAKMDLEMIFPSPSVSFMALYDDCIMHTFSTLNRGEDIFLNPGFPWPKVIRILNFAPDL